MVLPYVGSTGAGHTENLCFFLFPGSITERDVHRHSGRMQLELERVADRLGVESPQIVKVDFRSPDTVAPEGGCPPRGYMMFGIQAITVLASPETSDLQIYGVAAHEFGHVVSEKRFRGLPPDVILLEGFPTWAGAEAFLAWHGLGSLDEAVRAIVEEGTYIPLSESNVPDAGGLSEAECWKRRDTRYAQWAGFAGFLIDIYGMNDFEKLWGAGAPSASDPGKMYGHYEVVLGRTLEELELQWLESLGVSSTRP